MANKGRAGADRTPAGGRRRRIGMNFSGISKAWWLSSVPLSARSCLP